jgi:hypothetical protein
MVYSRAFSTTSAASRGLDPRVDFGICDVATGPRIKSAGSGCGGGSLVLKARVHLYGIKCAVTPSQPPPSRGRCWTVAEGMVLKAAPFTPLARAMHTNAIYRLYSTFERIET